MKTTFHEGKWWTVTAIRKHPFEFAELARPGERTSVAVHRLTIQETPTELSTSGGQAFTHGDPRSSASVAIRRHYDGACADGTTTTTDRTTK